MVLHNRLLLAIQNEWHLFSEAATSLSPFASTPIYASRRTHVPRILIISRSFARPPSLPSFPTGSYYRQTKSPDMIFILSGTSSSMLSDNKKAPFILHIVSTSRTGSYYSQTKSPDMYSKIQTPRYIGADMIFILSDISSSMLSGNKKTPLTLHIVSTSRTGSFYSQTKSHKYRHQDTLGQT